jgi:hypothetical protein
MVMDFLYVPIIILGIVGFAVSSTVKHNEELDRAERERIELIKKAKKGGD